MILPSPAAMPAHRFGWLSERRLTITPAVFRILLGSDNRIYPRTSGEFLQDRHWLGGYKHSFLLEKIYFLSNSLPRGLVAASKPRAATEILHQAKADAPLFGHCTFTSHEPIPVRRGTDVTDTLPASLFAGANWHLNTPKETPNTEDRVFCNHSRFGLYY